MRRALVAGIALCVAAPLLALGQDIPRHLGLARELVDNIRPENNEYKLGGEYVSFPGDSPSAGYAMRADCSGLLLSLFARSGYQVRSQMPFLVNTPGRRRPRAEDFVLSIEKERGFKRLTRVQEIRPGDILAHAMLEVEDKQHAGTTGHVFLISSAPRKIWGWNPVVSGTTQYEVEVIDSNRELLGDNDTRIATGKTEGLGRGTIRLYADAEGLLVGWAPTFNRSKVFFSYDPRFPSQTKKRKAAIGRPQERS